MIKDIYNKAHKTTTYTLKRVNKFLKDQKYNKTKIVTLGGFLRILAPNTKMVVSDTNNKVIYDFNMYGIDVLIKHWDDEVEHIGVAMFPDIHDTKHPATVLSIKLK